MREKNNIILYLLSRDERFLPGDFPNHDIRRLRKKNDLQRARLAKRMISELIKEMKETNTLFLFKEDDKT